jgi:hypothetical protein
MGIPDICVAGHVLACNAERHAVENKYAARSDNAEIKNTHDILAERRVYARHEIAALHFRTVIENRYRCGECNAI